MYSVVVCDLFHEHEPDHQVVVEGFPDAASAVEYARRRLRDSIEGLREPGDTPDRLRARWRAFGEDCWVHGPEGPFYRASSELETVLRCVTGSGRRDRSPPTADEGR